jgi:hypothetical protein
MTRDTDRSTSTEGFRQWLAGAFPGMVNAEYATIEQRIQRARLLEAWDARGDWEKATASAKDSSTG